MYDGKKSGSNSSWDISVKGKTFSLSVVLV